MPRASRFTVTTLAGGTTLALLAVLAGAAPAALSAPGGSKVTICHRTHSVTNPYRMITVNANAADGLGGRGDHTSHDLAYEYDGGVAPIFDPSID